jgi:hypothetical protein
MSKKVHARVGGVAQVIEYLPSKHEALSSNPPITAKKKKKKKKLHAHRYSIKDYN